MSEKTPEEETKKTQKKSHWTPEAIAKAKATRERNKKLRKEAAAKAKAELEQLRAEVERLEECMKQAGLLAFMKGKSPEHVARHLRSVTQSYVSSIEEQRQVIEKQRAVIDDQKALLTNKAILIEKLMEECRKVSERIKHLNDKYAALKGVCEELRHGQMRSQTARMVINMMRTSARTLELSLDEDVGEPEEAESIRETHAKQHAAEE